MVSDTTGSTASLAVEAFARLCHLLSIKDLPLWAKSLIAPAVVLVAMFAMAGTAFVNLAHQETDVAHLDSVAFEGIASGDGCH